MRINRCISSALVMISALLLSTSLPVAAKSGAFMESNTAVFTAIDFVSNIETIGVAVSGTGLPPTAQLSYRRSGESLWHPGHPLIRIDDGRLIGSLFNLSPATSYEFKVGSGSSEINGSANTQADGLFFSPSVVLNVDDNALPGGDGSAAAPFQTIQDAVDHAAPGTQVLVADGIYREAVTFPASGTPGNWIQVKAAGSAAILDSADYLSGSIWTSTSTAKVWFTKIDGPVAYLARGGNRFYQYDDKTGLMQATGHGGITINEGWYYEPGTQQLYIRNLDNPANYMWRLPRLNHAFDIAARDWLWIEGFEIRFYGTTTNGCGVCTLNASHLVIRRNKIHNMQLGIFINWNGTDDEGNDTRIEGNEVYDPLVNEWPWAAVKASYMEGTGIIIRGHIGAIVRDNNVHNFFNGIYTGSSGALENAELAFDADIYNNYIHYVSDDGLEPEGACVNQRFRNNTVDRSFIGISIAPITQGPTWVLRNAFTGFTGRGIKYADNSDGTVLIYQNTGWTSVSNINGADLITSIHNVVMRNNIFQSTGYSFAEVPTGSTANDWNYDNWYTTKGSTGPHFKWENVNYNTIAALCSARGLECNGNEDIPGFTNPAAGDFTLLSSSPNIDRGVAIPGINDDFVGNAPDLGAYEFAFIAPPTVLSSVRTNTNPSNVSSVGFTIKFSKSVTGVNIDDFALTTSGVINASVSAVSGSGTTYTVSVNTGTGNGSIRLDVLDNDSIKDAMNNPLGGAGTGNGNFTNGEIYVIMKSADITGNAGLAGVKLSYLDGTSKSVTSDGSGNYSIIVPYGWTGTVTPYKTGYIFTPFSRTYTSLQGNQAAQNYTAQACASCADVSVLIGTETMGNYTVPTIPSLILNYPNTVNGPVKVKRMNGENIFTSQRTVYGTSFNEVMGFPADRLTTEYWFPWYDHVYMRTWILIGNPSTNQTAEVDVYIGKSSTLRGHYSLLPGSRVTPEYNNVLDGPVRVVSTNGVNIFSSERVTYQQSVGEIMGYPADQLTTEYWFPWYDHVYMRSWIVIANPTNSTAEVDVYIGSNPIPVGHYSIEAKGRVTPEYNNILNGPVRVVSTNGVNIFSSQRVTYQQSVSEVMGYPANQFTTEYFFPWYDRTGPMKTWTVIGNPTNFTAEVDLYIGNMTTPKEHFSIPGKGRVTPFYQDVSSGPVRVVSTNGVNIFSSQRVTYTGSVTEVMGYPGNRLTSEYWFTWYDSVWMSTNIVIGQ